MKLAPRTFAIQWELHAWVGAVASLFVFVVFYCGVFALFKSELEVWQDPQVAVGAVEPQSIDAIAKCLGGDEKTKKRFAIGFYPGTRFVHVGRRNLLDPKTCERFPVRSRFADELYELHFFDRVPLGRVFAGIVAMLLLVITVTGLLVHLKDLKRQIWQFRPHLRVRFSASDAHKVLGVFGLPFVVVLAWSGAILCLFSVLAPAAKATVYRGDEERFERVRFGPEDEKPHTGHAVAPMPFDELLSIARRTSGGGRLNYFDVSDRGDEASMVRFYFEDADIGKNPYAHLDAATGAIRTSSAADERPGSKFEQVMYALHYGHFGGLALKFLYALLALGLCAVVITGNIVWLERRDPTRARRGNRFLERVTYGASIGLVAGTSVCALANRLLPIGLGHRALIETWVLYAVWAIAAIATSLHRDPRRVTEHLLLFTAAAFFAVAALGLSIAASLFVFLAFAALLTRKLIHPTVP